MHVRSSATRVPSQMGERVELERSLGSNIRHWNAENAAATQQHPTHKPKENYPCGA